MYIEDLDKTTPPLTADGWEETSRIRKGGMSGPPRLGSMVTPNPEEGMYGTKSGDPIFFAPELKIKIPEKPRDVSEGIASEGFYEHRKTVGKLNIPGKGSSRKTRRAKGGNRGDVVVALMEIRDQIKVYHWQTSKYARHIATNDLVTSLDANIDQFVEVYMGKYGRPKITKTIKLHNFSESAARAFVAKQTDFLTTKMPKMLKSTDSDLLNIRDTILADVNKTLYLFTLK